MKTLHSGEKSFQKRGAKERKIARFIGAAKINIFKSSSVTAAHFSCNKAMAKVNGECKETH